MPNSVTYQTPTFEWCKVRCDSERGQQKGKYVNYSRSNSHLNWGWGEGGYITIS